MIARTCPERLAVLDWAWPSALLAAGLVVMYLAISDRRPKTSDRKGESGLRKWFTMRELAAVLLVLALTGCRPTAADGELEELRARIGELEAQLRRVEGTRLPVDYELYEDLPGDVRSWVDLFTSARVGAHRRFGDRVYLVASWPGVALSLSRVEVRTDEVAVVAWAGPAFPGRRPFAVGSVAASDWPSDREVNFRLEGSLLGFGNRLGLPEVPLPSGARIALVTPSPGQVVSSPLRVAGFATLFEAWVAIRLLDAEGRELAAGGAHAGFYNWDSFQTSLEFDAPPGTELVLVLEETATEGDAPPHGIRIPLKAGK